MHAWPLPLWFRLSQTASLGGFHFKFEAHLEGDFCRSSKASGNWLKMSFPVWGSLCSVLKQEADWRQRASRRCLKRAAQERGGVGSTRDKRVMDLLAPASKLLGLFNPWLGSISEPGLWGFEDVSVLPTVRWRNCLWLSFQQLLLIFELFLDQIFCSWSLGVS